MSSPWMLDEMAYAGPEHLDPAFVAGYDRKQGYPDFTEDVAVLRGYGASTVVDLGAGSGRFALAAAREFDRVVAVDISPAMLALIGSRASASGLSNLEYVRAGFLTYQHSGPPADAVFTRNALHQLPDRRRGTRARTTPSTSAPSTARSGGCSSRCSTPPGSGS